MNTSKLVIVFALLVLMAGTTVEAIWPLVSFGIRAAIGRRRRSWGWNNKEINFEASDNDAMEAVLKQIEE
uniref:Uncharacterized protein n=1 Tax=Ciona intestinalis TaxID=7719 RepID=H2XSV1_CIOIN